MTDYGIYTDTQLAYELNDLESNIRQTENKLALMRQDCSDIKEEQERRAFGLLFIA